MKKIVLCGCAAMLVVSGLGTLAGAAIVPDRFEVRIIATDLMQPKGIDTALHRAGIGPAGDGLFIAESGANRIVRIDPDTGDMSVVADTLGSFPVGVACYGGPFDQNMYVGNAFFGGIVKIDPDGNTSIFAMPNLGIAGMDFGKGPFGADLYAGEWASGNIWRIDRQGNVTLFTTLPQCQTRYLRFSHGGDFGNFLYVTDFITGDIYRVDPTGAFTRFAGTGSPCLEGLDFSFGGAFGKYLYTGDVCTGDLFRVAPDGTVELWASGFDGVADIHFEPGKMGGATMYFVDGRSSVFAIHRVE